MLAKILVADSISQQGIAILEQNHDVDIKTGLSSEELIEIVNDYEDVQKTNF